MNDERPDDGGPPPPPAPPPVGRRVHPLVLGCAGVATFAAASIVFLIVGMASMDSRVLGFLIPLVIAGSVIWLFVQRKRSGSPAPLLGAAVVGLSIATIVYGLCYASMGNFRIQ